MREALECFLAEVRLYAAKYGAFRMFQDLLALEYQRVLMFVGIRFS